MSKEKPKNPVLKGRPWRHRGFRSGSWVHNYHTIAQRNRAMSSSSRDSYVGFRIARTKK